ncbi:MAG TPA: alpha/beta hydrolase [Phenylobacterium sp.]|nr:alpha/beta hydrolase [Phenylobacterium sp.]
MSRLRLWGASGLAGLATFLSLGALDAQAAAEAQTNAAFAITDPKGIDEEQFLAINGADQWVTIRGRDRANPVILVVGGFGTDSPGAVASPFLGAFQSWEPDFTVVQWDTRGAGKTFAKAGNKLDPDLGVDLLMRDALTLTDLLRQRLGKRKIVLLGVGFGSTLAARLALDHPDRYSAYVAAGQIADRRIARETAAIAYVRALAEARGDQAALADLQFAGPHPFSDMPRDPKKVEAWMRGSTPFRPRVPPNQRGDVLSAPHWSVTDALAIRLGQDASEAKFGKAWGEDFDYAGLSGRYSVPVFLIQGDNDFDAPLSLSKAWLDRIWAPAKSITVIPGAGDHAIQTDPDAYLKVLRSEVRPWAIKGR